MESITTVLILSALVASVIGVLFLVFGFRLIFAVFNANTPATNWGKAIIGVILAIIGAKFIVIGLVLWFYWSVTALAPAGYFTKHEARGVTIHDACRVAVLGYT